MTQQKLDYATGLAQKKNEIKADLIWLANLPEGELEDYTWRDVEKIKKIAQRWLEELHFRVSEEFKQL